MFQRNIGLNDGLKFFMLISGQIKVTELINVSSLVIDVYDGKQALPVFVLDAI